ncbi:MAG: hypothetical protein AAGG11_07280 [Pseudomonadota bacterium]
MIADAESARLIFSSAAFVLTFALFVPYVLSIQRGTTVPHVFSWIIWAFGTFVVFLAQLADGGGIGAWPIGFSACITAYIALLAFQRRHRITITRIDWVLLALAASATPAWSLTADPLWAVVLLTAADLIGFGPTLRHAFFNPHLEHPGFFLFGAVRNTFVILALENLSWTTVLFPAAVGGACLLLALLLLIRRSMLARNPLK